MLVLIHHIAPVQTTIYQAPAAYGRPEDVDSNFHLVRFRSRCVRDNNATFVRVLCARPCCSGVAIHADLHVLGKKWKRRHELRALRRPTKCITRHDVNVQSERVPAARQMCRAVVFVPVDLANKLAVIQT